MKDEKELWLNENELLNLLEGKMTWEQIHGKPENGSFAKDELSGMKRSSAWEARGNRQGGSSGAQLMPMASNLSRSTVHNGEKESRNMTPYQKPQAPQILPGPANETEWLNPQNPNLRTIDSNDQNVFFLQRPTSSTQEAISDHPGEQKATTSLTFRGDTQRNGAPAISATRAFAVTPASEHKLNTSKHRDSLHNIAPEKSAHESRFFNDASEQDGFFNTNSRASKQKTGTQFYEADFTGTFFQNSQNERTSDSKGFFGEALYSGDREFFTSEAPADNEGFFEITNNPHYFDSMDTTEYLQKNEFQGTDAPVDSDVPFVSMFSDVTDVRRAPVVKIGAHESAKKQPLALPSSNRTKALAEGAKAKTTQTNWDNPHSDNPHSDNQASNQFGDKDRWNIASADSKIPGMNRGALNGAGLAAQARPNSLTGMGFVGGKPLEALDNVNEALRPGSKNNRLPMDSQGFDSYYQEPEKNIPNVSFDQLNWSKPSVQDPYAGPIQYSPEAQTSGDFHTEEPYRDDRYTGDPYAAQPFATDPYAAQPFAADPYAAQPYAADPYAAQPFATDPYAAQPYADDPYAARSYTADPYAADNLSAPVSNDVNAFRREHQKPASNQFASDQFSDELGPYEYEPAISKSGFATHQFDANTKQNNSPENQFEFTVNKYVPTADQDNSPNQFEASPIDYEDSLVNRIRRDRFSMTSDENDNDLSMSRNSYEKHNRSLPLDTEEDKIEQLHRSRRSEDFNQQRTQDMLARPNQYEPENDSSQGSRFANPGRYENRDRFQEYDNYDAFDDRQEDARGNSKWVREEEHSQNIPPGMQTQFSSHKQPYETSSDRYNDHSTKEKDFALNYGYEQDEYFGGHKEEDAVDKYFSSDRRAMRSSQREARQEMVNLESQYDDYADYDDEYEKKPFGVSKIIIIALAVLVLGIGGFLAVQAIF